MLGVYYENDANKNSVTTKYWYKQSADQGNNYI